MKGQKILKTAKSSIQDFTTNQSIEYVWDTFTQIHFYFSIKKILCSVIWFIQKINNFPGSKHCTVVLCELNEIVFLYSFNQLPSKTVEVRFGELWKNHIFSTRDYSPFLKGVRLYLDSAHYPAYTLQ